MERKFKHSKFFRFRSPAPRGLREGATGEGLWLAPSLCFIDFNYEVFLSECILIGFYTKGMFSYNYLQYLDFNKYEIILREVKKINKGNDGK